MADSILRLKVESQEYDAKLKRAAEGLNKYVEQCRKVGGTLENVEKETLDFVKAMGQMETVSKTSTGKLSEMKRTFTEWSMIYKQISAAEKASPFGKALSQSLDQLKGRIKETQKDLQSINQELNGSSNAGQFGNILDTFGQKLGVTGNLTEMLTSKTALMTGAIGASTTVVIAATKAWADYNSEIAKQQQITTVTTGLKGDDADRMTAAARALSKTYNTDFREAVNAANTLMTQFGKSGDEAIQLLRDGMQGMIMGDGPKLLSMIQQYAPAFRDAGVSASQLVAVIQNSEGGIFTAENMNAIVMGIKNIRLMTKQTGDALAQIGIDGREVTKALNEGTMTIFDALKLVAGQLKDVDSNSQAAGQVMQAVFGRQGAMAGTNLAKAIEGLNTNLEETKRQTGEVGKAYDDLYQANVRLEQALQKTFGYKGWEEMATGIKTKLVSAMANVLELTNKINEAFNNKFGVSFFEGIYNASTRALGPLGTILRLLKDINKEKGGAAGGGTGTPKNEDFEYIKGGATKQEREDRYNKTLSDINTKLSEIGQEKTRKNADGSTSFYIDPLDVQQQQRQQLLNQRTQLVMNRDALMAGSPAKTTPYQFEPFKPTPTTTTKGGHTVSKPEQAQAKFDQAEKDYQQALAQAAMEMKAGTITEADAKKKELQARENLWKSIGDAREIYDSPKLEEAQRNVENEIIYFGGIVKSAADQQEAAKKAAKELEAAQKKLSDAETERATALQQNDLKAFYAANKKVVGAGGEATNSIDFTYTSNNLDAFIANLKQRISEADVGSELLDSLNDQMADAQTLGNIMETALKNGIDAAQFDPQELFRKIFGDGKTAGDYIKNEVWQNILNSMSQQSGKKFSLDTRSGAVSERKGGKDGVEQFMGDFSKVTGSISSIASGIQNLGVEIPEGLAKTLGAIQTISGILTAILTITTLIQATQTANTGINILNSFARIGMMAIGMNRGGVVPKFAEGGVVPKFAEGGVVPKFAEGGLIGRAAAGMMIPGNSFSGDHLRMPVDGGRGVIGVNSGELILNKSSQANLAAMIRNAESLVGMIDRYQNSVLDRSQMGGAALRIDGGGLQNLRLSATVTGEQIRLVLNNNGLRTGRGEYVTTNFQRG